MPFDLAQLAADCVAPVALHRPDAEDVHARVVRTKLIERGAVPASKPPPGDPPGAGAIPTPPESPVPESSRTPRENAADEEAGQPDRALPV